MIHLFKILIVSFFIQLLGCYYLRKSNKKAGNDASSHEYVWGLRCVVIGIIFQLFIILAILIDNYLFRPYISG